MIWITEGGRKQIWVAAKLGIPPDRLSRWLAGTHSPTEQERAGIAELTEGAVPAKGEWK